MPNFFINVKEKGAKKAAGNIKSLTGSLKMMAIQAVSVTAVVQGLRKSISMSAEMEGVKRGFDNLAKSSGFSTSAFNKFKKATDGTVSSLELMKQANNAMLLGITDSEEQMASMFDVAQRLGQSLGLDTVQAVESLVTGLGRQSKLMLDNLGIMVDTNKAYEDYADSIGKTTSELTDQERKTAFVNAAMAEANTLVSSLGEEQLTTADKISQMQTALGDLAITIGDKVAPFVSELAGNIATLVEEISMLGMTPLEKMVKSLEDIGADEGLVNALKIDIANEKIEGLKTKIGDVGEVQMNIVKAQAQENIRLIEADTKWFKEKGSLTDDLVARTKEDIEIQQEKIDIANKDLAIIAQIKVLEAQILTMKKEESEIVPAIVITDDDLVALAEFETLQQAKLDKYTLEQELIAALIEANPQLAASLNLVTDATKDVTKAKEAQGKAEIDLMKATASAFKEFAGGAKIAARIQQTAATIDAYRTINKIMADPKLLFPTNVLMATTVGATAFANVASISKSIGDFKTAATGMDEIVTKPTMILAGEAGAESVQITPLNSVMNENGVQGGGGSLTVNISGNLMSSEYVEGELADQIKEAIRRGTDFGIS